MCAGHSDYLLSIRKLIIWSEKLSVLNDLLRSTTPSFLLLFCGFAWFRSLDDLLIWIWSLALPCCLLRQVQVLDHLHGVFGVDCPEWYTGQMLGIAIRKSRNTKRCPMLVPGTRVPE
jgi:hypothetical protein